MNGVVQVDMLLAFLVRKPELQSAMGERTSDKFLQRGDAFQVVEAGSKGEQHRNQHAAGYAAEWWDGFAKTERPEFDRRTAFPCRREAPPGHLRRLSRHCLGDAAALTI